MFPPKLGERRMPVGSLLVMSCVLAACLAQERRAMGFVGMRGKKDTPDMEEYKRAPSTMGFQGVRGKKDDLIGEPDDTFLEEFKRAPAAMGFQGMRGKKTPAMGFMGMRGKKDSDYGWWEEDKRAPASGFFGMRGKKAPASGFFGMRGKKGPSSSAFFGMRGKKGPSGFMGVRGKKDSPDDLNHLLQLLRESALKQEMEEMLEDGRGLKRFAGLSDSFEDYPAELL
ncbi:tachykinin isoform X2 [Rhodnius prolixus]|uniref:tachykinin isoform X2 n=1 Tax=Rhodnius prolixus TaxID=13249 RepID=UPI003D18A0B5